MILNCPHFQQQHCVSCQWLEKPYSTQLINKEADLKRLISPFILQKFTEILPPVQSSQKQFRNKAKMVVSGSVERPILGILKDQTDPQSGIDLCDCPLYPAEFKALFPILKILSVELDSCLITFQKERRVEIYPADPKPI
ncbi:23S rRNA methyluridine methyltransferase [Actinobacillus equuli]|nr:23S rRNA methyluridine methyltransferase [Actinobacillus equuli]